MALIVRTGLILFLSVGATGPNEVNMGQREARSPGLRLPRDGDIAVREELDAARRARTVEAYDFFLRRHPEHRLAQIARRERIRILARGDKVRD